MIGGVWCHWCQDRAGGCMMCGASRHKQLEVEARRNEARQFLEVRRLPQESGLVDLVSEAIEFGVEKFRNWETEERKGEQPRERFAMLEFGEGEAG